MLKLKRKGKKVNEAHIKGLIQRLESKTVRVQFV